MFGNVQISQATGIQIPNIAANWPQLAYVMAEAGHMSDLEQIGMIATVAVETNVYVNHVSRGFYPIKELGGDIYFEKNYGCQTDIGKRLGNTNPDDGARYCGRGLIQTTGKANYLAQGIRLKLDLINNPDLLLVIENASLAAVDYFNDRKIWDLCLAKDWEKVRRRVNGGTNGLPIFLQTVNKLLGMVV